MDFGTERLSRQEANRGFISSCAAKVWTCISQNFNERRALAAITGWSGYFIIKKATLDNLTNQLAETRARITSLEQQNSSLQRENSALTESLEEARASNVSA